MSPLFWSLLRVMTVRDADALLLETGKVPVLYRQGRPEPLAMAALERDQLGDLERALAGYVPIRVRDAQGRLFEVLPERVDDDVRVLVRSKTSDSNTAVDLIENAGTCVATVAMNELVVRAEISGTRFELVAGDIAEQDTDAVVTAAHWDLAGGQGTDGAIHFRAGPRLLEECRRIGWCPVGSAVITGGYGLKARHVIHAVGPVWDRGLASEPELLTAAYQHSLRLAAEHGLRSISFPSLSTGAFCYPMHLAAPIAIKAIVEFLDRARHELLLVRMVVYRRGPREVREIFREALRETGRLTPIPNHEGPTVPQLGTVPAATSSTRPRPHAASTASSSIRGTGREEIASSGRSASRGVPDKSDRQ